MRKIVNNFLSLGHHFSENENLQQFRFSLLNIFIVVAILFALLHVFIIVLGILEYNTLFILSLLIFSMVSIFSQFTLRRNKKYYLLVVHIFLFLSASLFYFVLFTHPEDEFRLIAFFLLVFIAFVLRGKEFGLLLSVFIFFSIFVIRSNFNLNLSSYALATFFTFFIIFSIFLYFFMQKIEKDALEFNLLNKQLRKKVCTEVEERKKQEEMLIQQYKKAKIGEMMDAITHQWKQPLMGINSIVMNIEREIEQTSDKHYIKSKVSELVELTTYMSNTIEDFRTLLTEEKIKQYFSIRTAIELALEICESSLSNIGVKIKSTKDMTFYGYENEFIQVIIILVSNAIEALNVKNVENKDIFIGLENYEKIIVTIEDNAGGIDIEKLTYIFNPYFSTKKSLGGTGLGLYIAKIIIEQNMQGKLDAINTQKGAKFTIEL